MNFYILNKDDVIVSTLSTESTTSEAAPLFKAELTEVLNGIHQLELVTVADSELTAEIKEDYTIIFKDEQGFKEFCIDEVVDSESSYISEKTVTATFSPIELKDELLLNNYTYDNASLLLNYMLKGTRWQLGTVDSAIYNRNFNEETENESVWTGINAVAKVFEADLYFHVSVSEKKVVQRYVSLYKQLGSNSGKRFEIDKDITEIKRTVDTTEIKTAIYPLGKETEDENGNKKRIDISSVSWSISKGDPVDKPAGQMFISDNEAKLQWGRRNSDGTVRDRFIFMEMDFDSPEALASMAWVQLGRYRKPKVTYEAKVIDLYRLTQDEELKHEKVFLGDAVSVIDRNFSNPIEITERVVQLKTDLLLPENTSVVIGNSKSSYSSDINRVDDIAKQLSSVESSVNSVITSANGKNKTYYGTVEPVHSELAIGDSWVRPHPENPTKKQWLTWNGTNWDIVLDTSETSQIRNDIEELDQISKETQEKADQAIEDAGFSKIEIGKINKELIEITADTDVALEEARQAKQQAFNSEQLANSAKQDAITAIQKGDQNSTQITTLEGQQQLTNTKVEGNTANILSLQADSEKLSLSIGKVQSDVDGINVGLINLASSKHNGIINSKPTDYWLVTIAEAKTQTGFIWKPDTEYTIVMNGKALEDGSELRWYLQHPPSYDLNQYDSIKTLTDSTKTKTFRTPKWEQSEPASLNIYNFTKTGGVKLNWIMVFEGNKAPKEYVQSQYELTTKLEFATFEANYKGFQQTVNSDITGLKSQQTQMAGQITSTVEKVDNLEFNNRNLVIGTPNPDIWFSSPQSSTSSDYTSDTKWVYPNDWGIGDFFRGFNFTTKTDITVSSKIKIEKVNGQPLKVADFPEDFVFSVFRITGTGTSWRDFAKIRRGQLKDGVSDYFVSETFKLTQGDIDTSYQNKFIRKWMRKFPDGYKVTLTEYILSSSTKQVLYQPAPEDNASKSEVIQLSDQITQTVNKVETVDGKVTSQQSQITQLSNRITTIASEQTELNTKYSKIEQTTDAIRSEVIEIGQAVSDIGTYVNYLINADDFSDSLPYSIGMSGPQLSLVKAEMAKGNLKITQDRAFQGYIVLANNTSSLELDTEYTFSGNFKKASLDIRVYFEDNFKVTSEIVLSEDGAFSLTFRTPKEKKTYYLYIKCAGTINQTSSMSAMKLNKGSKRVENTVDTASLNARISKIEQTSNGLKSEVAVIKNDQIVQSSQITQLSDNINLRVEKNKVISQINISPETIRIESKLIHLSGKSLIDNAVIKSAMIDTMTANKLTAGTINAAEINVINMNASNLVSGKISAIDIEGSNITGSTFTTVGTATAVVIKQGLLTISHNNNGMLARFGYNSTWGQGLSLEIPKGLWITGTQSTQQGFFALEYRNNKMWAWLPEIRRGITCVDSTTSYYTADYYADPEGRAAIVGYDGVFFGERNSGGTINPLGEWRNNQLEVFGSLKVRGSKNAIHETSQGWVATPAYETAESYLGDIGTGKTDSEGNAVILIEELFSEVINTTDVEYQVFLQSYSFNNTVFVVSRNEKYFKVKSKLPHAEFAYEIKAKRKGYENDRLEKVEEQ